jgi:uroporphyrinogen III methyltransferase/synthase
VTGHDPEAIDWTRIGTSETLVIFMGIQHIDDITQELLRIGRLPETPAMVVQWGTRPDQHTVAAPLAKLPAAVHSARLTPPATIVVGDVVSLREKLTWFERLPLRGLQIVVTRARDQAGVLTELLQERGAAVLEVPVIELAPLSDYSVLDACIRQLEQYDWIIFTSTNTVQYFFSRLAACDRDSRAIRGRICAIGSATELSLRERYLRADLVPSDHSSEGVAAAFEAHDLQGRRVLLPRASAARDVIPDALSRMGAEVDVADAYINVIPENAAARMHEAQAHRPDWIIFMSPSAVNRFMELGGGEMARAARLASIGPTTSDSIHRHGLRVDVEAKPSTLETLVEAIVDTAQDRSLESRLN